MAAKKRKSARKAVKKSTARTHKRTGMSSKAKGRAKSTPKKSPAAKLARQPSVTSVDRPFTKGQLFSILAGCAGLTRKDVTSVFDELGTIIAAHLKKQGPGQFTLPGLAKISIKHKPATKARKGINPFTGEETMFKAKPARNVVKIRPLQRLKAMVA